MDRDPFDDVDDALGMDDEDLRQRASEARQKREKAEWLDPDLSLLDTRRAAPPPFPVELLGPWAEWAAEQAETASAPVDYVAMAMLALAGACIANTRWGSPWRSWHEPPVLNIGIVGLPSAGKSPAVDVVFGPLRAAERDLAEGFPAIHAAWRKEAERAAVVYAEWQKEWSMRSGRRR